MTNLALAKLKVVQLRKLMTPRYIKETLFERDFMYVSVNMFDMIVSVNNRNLGQGRNIMRLLYIVGYNTEFIWTST
jgi:hypothetical protein